MNQIPPSSPQPPQIQPPTQKTKQTEQQSIRGWARFAVSVTKHLISTGIRNISGSPPKRTTIDKRSIQHITSNENGSFIKTDKLHPKTNHFRTLGSGGEGRADLVFEGLAGKLEVKKTFFDAQNRPDTEIKLLKRLDHPNIIKITPQTQDSDRGGQGIHMSNGGAPLTGLVPTTASRTRISPNLFCSIARQLANSLTYLKEEQVLHRDIKPDNIVIDPTGHITLIDFGMAYDHKTRTSCNPSGVGTLRYMPPDTLRHRDNQVLFKYSNSADMFAAGQTLFELVTGYPLKFPEFRQYPNQTEQEAWNIYKRDLSTLDRIGPSVAHSLPRESRAHIVAVTNLLKRMLHPDPNQRITPEQLKKHPLIAEQRL